MKGKIISFLFLLTLLGMLGCSVQKQEQSLLMKKWIESPAEHVNDVLTFRPEGYPVQQARRHNVMKFAGDGIYEGLVTGPTDKSISQKGTWVYDSKTKLITINMSMKGQVQSIKYQLVNIEKDKLQVVRK